MEVWHPLTGSIARRVLTLFCVDIEDILKTLAFLYGKKWTTMLVSRTYFGNWLRDYSQAIDVGSLKAVNAATIRILVCSAALFEP
jgi:hypothetical protein